MVDGLLRSTDVAFSILHLEERHFTEANITISLARGLCRGAWRFDLTRTRTSQTPTQPQFISLVRRPSPAIIPKAYAAEGLGYIPDSPPNMLYP